MMNLLAIQLVVAVAMGVSTKASQASPPHSGPAFYCNMNALSAEERAQLPGVLKKLISSAPVVKELKDGYELYFAKSQGLYPLAAVWTSAENRCCPFFDFSLKVARYGGPMTIRMTGPDGVKEFIADDLPLLHKLTTGKG